MRNEHHTPESWSRKFRCLVTILTLTRWH